MSARLRLLGGEERELLRQDRSAYPVAGPLVMMGAGFGVSALGVCLLFLSSGNAPRNRHFDRSMVAVQAVSLPVGFGGLLWTRHNLDARPNRARVQELEQERVLLKRELKEIRRAQRRALIIVPAASLETRTVSLSLRSSF